MSCSQTLSMHAEHTRDENEVRSVIAWWIAVVLYTFGWLLAVVGRLQDLPLAAE
jgi:hypothetical protein